MSGGGAFGKKGKLYEKYCNNNINILFADRFLR